MPFPSEYQSTTFNTPANDTSHSTSVSGNNKSILSHFPLPESDIVVKKNKSSINQEYAELTESLMFLCPQALLMKMDFFLNLGAHVPAREMKKKRQVRVSSSEDSAPYLLHILLSQHTQALRHPRPPRQVCEQHLYLNHFTFRHAQLPSFSLHAQPAGGLVRAVEDKTKTHQKPRYLVTLTIPEFENSLKGCPLGSLGLSSPFSSSVMYMKIIFR